MPREDSRNILIVDDDENTIVLIKSVLSDEKYEIMTALSGNEAIEIVKKNKVHLIISDIRMPGINGLLMSQVVRKIKPKIKIILMTAFGDVETYLEALDIGIFEYFHKPLDLNMFRETVSRALQ